MNITNIPNLLYYLNNKFKRTVLQLFVIKNGLVNDNVFIFSYLYRIINLKSTPLKLY